ncbi:AAA family ATPase [Listeria ilorinensis]|uniref:AAA family ATPase n=1 Tax=Listeria ilorinensis TaxID=2867439 RepID=UPI001EF60299|nr:AAA family ATPase [Listeria ilorinensis]
MKTIKLKSLELENFKGIKQLTVNFGPEQTSIFGGNGTGKTTILDAFTWLLFDKDSTNKKDFAIKTKDTDGKDIPRLDHVVKAVLLVEGEETEITKKLVEKWTRKRGEADQEFSGNTTEYHIDGIKQKASEFKVYVNSLVDEEVFKLITNPLFFNEQYEWKKRREMLVQIAGDISDQDVIESNDKLKELTAVLGKHSVNDKLKQIAEQKKDLKKVLDLTPDRISEATLAKEDVTGLDPSDISGEIQVIQDQINAKQDELQLARNGGMKANLLKQKANIEAELAAIKSDYQTDLHEQIGKKNKELTEMQNTVANADMEIGRLINESTALEQDIKRMEEQLMAKGDEWREVNTQTFDKHRKSCPTCGQTFPANQIEKMIANFKNEKAEKEAAISAAGFKLKEDVAATEEKRADALKKIEELQGTHGQFDSSIVILKEELAEMRASLEKYAADPVYLEAQKELEMVMEQMQDENGASTARASEIQTEIDQLQREIASLQVDLNKFNINKRQDDRIAELNQQMDDAAEKYNELEQALYLIETFNKSKSSMLEERINSKFKYVNFQLFKQNINGGIEECCETLYNGVPYNSGLNNAARINGGLDIINTLSEHLELTAPVFIDNRESVIDLVDTEAQIINLIVSEQDKNLRVEA